MSAGLRLQGHIVLILEFHQLASEIIPGRLPGIHSFAVVDESWCIQTTLPVTGLLPHQFQSVLTVAQFWLVDDVIEHCDVVKYHDVLVSDQIHLHQAHCTGTCGQADSGDVFITNNGVVAVFNDAEILVQDFTGARAVTDLIHLSGARIQQHAIGHRTQHQDAAH